MRVGRLPLPTCETALRQTQSDPREGMIGLRASLTRAETIVSDETGYPPLFVLYLDGGGREPDR